MTSEIDRQTPDFLVADKYADTSQEFRDLSLSNQILLGIWREIRKAHPSQRCVISSQFSNAAQVLNNGTDIVDIRFLAMGKPVQAQYLIISNNTDIVINVGLNDPVLLNAAGTFATGIRMPAGTTQQFPIEIEKIQIRLDTVVAGPLAIPINNGRAGLDIPVAGTISVYAWTIPFSDRDDTE